MSETESYVIYLGVASGNPGPSGWGALVCRGAKRAALGGVIDPEAFGVPALDFAQAQLGTLRESLKLLAKKVDAPAVLVAGAAELGALARPPAQEGRFEAALTALARAELATCNAARPAHAQVAVRERTPADLPHLDEALALALKGVYGKDHPLARDAAARVRG